MKGQLLFAQGGGSGTHDEWDNKLVESLQHALGEAFEIHYPRMPNEDDPSFAAWRSALEDATGELRMAHREHHYLFCLPREDAPALIVAIFHERMDLLTRLEYRLQE